MDFYDELDKRGLLDMLRVPVYDRPAYQGWEKAKCFLLDIVVEQKSVYVVGDYDVDGLMCAMICKDCFKDLGVKDFTIYNYRSRTHNIDSVAVQQCIQGHYDYFVVADAGSNDMGLLKQLVHCGVKVIVLDHHNTEFAYSDYGDNIAVINTMIENKAGTSYKLSAGALCFTVFDLLYLELGKSIPAGIASYAAVSLLADMMDMSDKLNRSIYYLGTHLPEDEIPVPLLYFKGDYSKFNARYISYWFSPRINACFRAEQFIFINELFFNDTDSAVKGKCFEMIERVYTKSRSMVHSVSDVLDAYCVQMQNFVFADLGSIDRYFDIEYHKLFNYTGYVANDLASKHGKTAITVCRVGNYYKGSLRDQLGRNYLQIFRQLCFAEGHNSAFGMRIPELDLEIFMNDLKRVDDLYSIQTIENEPIVVEIGNTCPDESMITDMARYNEFAGSGVPVALLRKQIIGNITESKNSYYYKYLWEGLSIQSEHKISFGRFVLIKPFFSWKLKLQVQ